MEVIYPPKFTIKRDKNSIGKHAAYSFSSVNVLTRYTSQICILNRSCVELCIDVYILFCIPMKNNSGDFRPN